MDFFGNPEVQIKKHVNTKHENEYVDAMIQERGDSIKSDCGFEGIDEMFQIK